MSKSPKDPKEIFPEIIEDFKNLYGENLISISSAIQPETDDVAQTAEIVIMTHPAREKAMQQALGELEQLEMVREINNFIRVEDI